MMTGLLALGILGFSALAPAAQDTDDRPLAEVWAEEPTRIFEAQGINLSEFRFIARPVIVFADSPNDPNFRHQMELLAERPEDLAERDVILITDTDPANPSALRLELRPRGFMLVLIDKEGGVGLRKPQPWDLRELTRSIDKFPLRQQEIEDRR